MAHQCLKSQLNTCVDLNTYVELRFTHVLSCDFKQWCVIERVIFHFYSFWSVTKKCVYLLFIVMNWFQQYVTTRQRVIFHFYIFWSVGHTNYKNVFIYYLLWWIYFNNMWLREKVIFHFYRLWSVGQTNYIKFSLFTIYCDELISKLYMGKIYSYIFSLLIFLT